jgi:uncharacterized membrane protein YcjF (UPF0283 family)
VSLRLLQVACIFAVLASAAGGSWWLYATFVRQDWLGLAMGLAAGLAAAAWGTGLILIDRGLRRLRGART